MNGMDAGTFEEVQTVFRNIVRECNRFARDMNTPAYQAKFFASLLKIFSSAPSRTGSRSPPPLSSRRNGAGGAGGAGGDHGDAGHAESGQSMATGTMDSRLPQNQAESASFSVSDQTPSACRDLSFWRTIND